MNCHEAKERLLEGRGTGAVRRHLERCEDCSAFAREVRDGGAEIAEAFLAGSPSPEFELRVADRIREREIAVAERPRRPRVRLAAAAVLLLAGGAWLAWRPGPAAPVAGEPDPPVVDATPVVVVTEPERENPLLVYVGREGTAAETSLELSFAGDSRRARLRSGADDEFLRAWAMGARRAEVTVGAEVPGREIALLLEALEKSGYEYQLLRRKPE